MYFFHVGFKIYVRFLGVADFASATLARTGFPAAAGEPSGKPPPNAAGWPLCGPKTNSSYRFLYSRAELPQEKSFFIPFNINCFHFAESEKALSARNRVSSSAAAVYGANLKPVPCPV